MAAHTQESMPPERETTARSAMTVLLRPSLHGIQSLFQSLAGGIVILMGPYLEGFSEPHGDPAERLGHQHLVPGLELPSTAVGHAHRNDPGAGLAGKGHYTGFQFEAGTPRPIG